MEKSINGICYLEQIIGDTGIFEFVLGDERLNCEYLINSDVYHVHMSLTKINKRLVKDYYYNFDISSEFVQGWSKISISESSDFLNILHYSPDNNNNFFGDHFYINFSYNKEINLSTKQYIDEKSIIVKRIGNVLGFLTEGASITNVKMNEFDNAANIPIRTSIAHYIKLLVDEPVEFDGKEESIKRALKEIFPYLNFKRWKDKNLSLYDLSQHLMHIKEYIESSSTMNEDKYYENIQEPLEEIIDFPGIGLTVMSTILSVLWKNKFIVYNPSFSLYLQRLGYKIHNYKYGELYNTGKGRGLNSDKISKVKHYLSYNKEVLIIINSAHEFFNIEPKYDIICNNIRKKFDILEMFFI